MRYDKPPDMARWSPHRVTRRELLKGAATAGVGIAIGAASHGFLYERRRLQLSRVDPAISGLPEALVGLRVAFLTDFHLSGSVPPSLIESAVRLALHERPDLVLLGGDYVSFHDARYMRPAAELLAPLSAPLGVFAVLGNHDHEGDAPEALASQGIEVLQDARTRLTVRGEPLDLAGLRFWTRRIVDIARVLEGATATTLLLSHDPRRLVEAAALDVGLVLSGHTHGGQIVLPVLGSPASVRFPLLEGIGRRDNTAIFVSRGVGTVYLPIRINCRPEVALLTLRRQASF